MGRDNGYKLPTRHWVERQLRDAPFVTLAFKVVELVEAAKRNGVIDKGGWMSSQRVLGTRLARRFAEGDFTAREHREATALLRRYSRLIGKVIRGFMLTRHPDLQSNAARFGVYPSEEPMVEGMEALLAEAEREGLLRDPPVVRTEEPSTEPDRAEGAPVVGHDSENPTETTTAEAPAAQEPAAERSAEGGGSALARATTERVLAFVAGHPGLRSEEIARETGIPAVDVSGALKDLVDAGKLERLGMARGSRYRIAE